MYYSYSAAQWLLVFYLYCMLGWCFESTVVSVGQRRLVNRGFLRGPMLPIYGFGARDPAACFAAVKAASGVAVSGEHDRGDCV